MNRVSVVVLNYKGIDDTIACLKSLAKQTYVQFSIVVVENGSNDGSAATLRSIQAEFGDKLTILFNKKNKGFAGGVNTGIRWALEKDYEYIALFNNDALADTQWLSELVASAEKNRAGITTGLLLHSDGKTIDSTGDWYSTWGMMFPRNRDDKAESAPESGYVFSATGGASLYRANMFRKIGLFDETFFAYYEDMDISFRAQLYGYKVYYTKQAIAYHEQGGTSKKIPGFTTYQTFKNLPLVFIKNVPKQLLLQIGIRFYLAYWLIYTNAVVHGNFIPATKGVIMSFYYGFQAIYKRHRIQKEKIVTSGYIINQLWVGIPPDQTGLLRFRKLFKIKKAASNREDK